MSNKTSPSSPPTSWWLDRMEFHLGLSECREQLDEVIQLLRTQTSHQNQTNRKQTPPHHKPNQYHLTHTPLKEENEVKGVEVEYENEIVEEPNNGNMLAEINIEEIEEALQEEESEDKHVEAELKSDILEESDDENMLVLGRVLHAPICPNEDQWERLSPPTLSHVQPCAFQWLSHRETLQITKQVQISFSLGKNHVSEVVCDVVPMGVCPLLLDRPWGFNRSVTNDGREDTCSLEFESKTITLAPLGPSQLYNSIIRAEHKKVYLPLNRAESGKLNPQHNKAQVLIVTMREEKGKIKVRKKWQVTLNEAYKEYKLISGLEDILLADLRTNPFQPGEIDVNPTPKQPISKFAQEETIREVLCGSKVHSARVVQLSDLRTNPFQQWEIDVYPPSRQYINLHVDQGNFKEEPFMNLEAIRPNLKT